MKKKKATNDAIGVAGFFRLKIMDHKDGEAKVVGDSGWCKNLVTNLGFQHFILEPMGQISGSSALSGAGNGWFALGTGAAPAVTDTSLAGELSDSAAMRFTMTAPTVVSSKTLQYLGTFASSIETATHAIANIGIFGASVTAAGSIFCGNTFAASTLQTNQSVNVTYQLKFATA